MNEIWAMKQPKSVVGSFEQEEGNPKRLSNRLSVSVYIESLEFWNMWGSVLNSLVRNPYKHYFNIDLYHLDHNHHYHRRRYHHCNSLSLVYVCKKIWIVMNQHNFITIHTILFVQKFTTLGYTYASVCLHATQQ